MKRLVCRTLAIASVLSFAFMFVGCGGDDGTDSTGDSKHDSKLILGDGYAWVGVVDVMEVIPMNAAVVFSSNGEMTSYMGVLGVWDVENSETNTWHTVGNKLILSWDDDEYGEADTSTYSVSGNTLRITSTYWDDDEDEEVTETFVLTKTEWPPKAIDREYDPELINTNWMQVTATGMEMWTFSNDEDSPVGVAVYMKVDMMTGEMLPKVYAWRTSGGKVYLSDGVSAEISYPYEIDDDELTLNGETYALYDGAGGDDDDRYFAPKAAAKQLLKAKSLKSAKSLGKKLSFLK